LRCAADILAMKITLDVAVMNDHGSTLLVQVANSLSGRNKPADALTLSDVIIMKLCSIAPVDEVRSVDVDV